MTKIRLTEVIDRYAAAEKGWSRYFTGMPCKRGHVCERFVSSSGCVECVNPKVRISTVSPGQPMADYYFRALLPAVPLTPAEAQELKHLVEHWIDYQLTKWGKLGPDAQTIQQALERVEATSPHRLNASKDP